VALAVAAGAQSGAKLKATREAWPLTLALVRERLGC